MELEETELDRECAGMKSSGMLLVGIICMFTAVIKTIVGLSMEENGPADGERSVANEKAKK